MGSPPQLLKTTWLRIQARSELGNIVWAVSKAVARNLLSIMIRDGNCAESSVMGCLSFLVEITR